MDLNLGFLNQEEEKILGKSRALAKALESSDLAPISMLYESHARMWGASSDKLLVGQEEIKSYYHYFITEKKDFKLYFEQQDIRIFGEIAINTGTYSFSWENGKKRARKEARFTLVYRKIGRDWIIVEHHSSSRP